MNLKLFFGFRSIQYMPIKTNIPSRYAPACWNLQAGIVAYLIFK